MEHYGLRGVIAVEDADFNGLFRDPDNDGFTFYRTLYQVAAALADLRAFAAAPPPGTPIGDPRTFQV